MTATLTDRYIFAATRGVPEKSRDDLRAELEASIDDAIDARVGAGETRDAAERAVLTDMGDPDRLAAGYTERPAHLIGPRYYFEWLRLLKLLLWIVLPFAALGISLGQVLSGADVGGVIGAAVVGTMTTAVHIGFWVTLVFAILERSDGDSALERGRMTKDGPWAAWTLDRLPDIRPKGLGTGELVASLVFLAITAVAVLWDRAIGFVWVDGQAVSILDPGIWPWWIVGLFVLLAAEVVFAVVLYRARRWTPGLAVVNTLLALVFAVPVIWLLLTGQLVNPDFFPGNLPGVEPSHVRDVGIVLAFVIGGIALWDIIDGILKTYRSGRSAPARS